MFLDHKGKEEWNDIWSVCILPYGTPSAKEAFKEAPGPEMLFLLQEINLRPGGP